jgi:hypothetical protein
MHMPSMSIKLIRVALLGSLLAICLAPSAFADSTYTYQGLNFTAFGGGDDCSSGVGECAISASLTLSQPLGDNFTGLVTATAFTISDGTNLLTQNTPGVTPIEFFFITGSSGAITSWNVDVATNSVELFTDTFGSNTNSANCGEGADGTSNAAGGCAVTPLGAVGSWSGPATATPEPSSVFLLGLGLLTFTILSFKRATA